MSVDEMRAPAMLSNPRVESSDGSRARIDREIQDIADRVGVSVR
jgi:hypothetical protein